LGARLQGHKQSGEGEPILVYLLQGPLQSQQLGMRSGITPVHRLVVGLGENVSIAHYDRAYRDFFPDGGRPRQAERGLHPGKVTGGGRSPTH
jgi:hypothetical protein